MPTSDRKPNEAQRTAIEHGRGPLRIQAGAGSGKTTTLVHRIRSLVERGLCRPEEILMLTFTTKAVEEMGAKVAAGIGTDGSQPRIDTYHAYAWSLVQEFAELLGLGSDPVLLTEGALRLFVRQMIDQLGLTLFDLTRTDDAVKAVLEFASWHRHEGTYRRDRTELLDALGPEDDRALFAELLRAFEAYRKLMHDRRAVDYDDVIALAVKLLEEHPSVRQDVTARFPFLLVDEYQDTDYLQGQLVRLLAGDRGDVTIVGDPDQTIYSFRGAAMTNIREFHEEWPDVTDVAMVTNYRSTPEIVAAANAVIRHNQRRKEELLVADRSPGPRPVVLSAPDWGSEARWLAVQARALHADGIPYGEMAILVRKNSHKLALYAACVEAGIPVEVVGGFDLFEDPEAVRFFGFVRALADPGDDGAIAVALSMPRYGLSEQEIAALAGERRRGENLLSAAQRTTATEPRLQRFFGEFWPLYARQFQQGFTGVVSQALRLHGSALGPQSRINAEQLLPLAESLMLRPDLFNGQGRGLSLFVQYVEAMRGVGASMEAVQIDSEAESVKLMTVHQAKGLEFSVLFLPRLTHRDFAPDEKPKWEEQFPLAWHHDKDFVQHFSALMAEEERRLFYVAVTRARDQLYLSWAPVDPARKRPLSISPFLEEMGEVCDFLAVSPAETEVAVTGETFDLQELLDGLVSDAPAPEAAVANEAGVVEDRLPDVLSFSHLHTYQLCPYRFYLQYVLRVVGRPSRAADEGVRVHAAIERHAASFGEVGFNELAQWAGTALPGEDRQPELEEERYEGGALDPLRTYWESDYARVAPVGVEQEFHLRVGGAVVRGFIDRIHPLPGGGLEVVDFKTYNRLQTEAEVRAGLQLPLYIVACREALGHPDTSQGALFFLKHGQAVRVRFSEEELAERVSEAEGLVAAIRAREWRATPGAACTYCPFSDLCPVAAR